MGVYWTVALLMHDLADVALVVRELAFVAKNGYLTPAERVRHVWNVHIKNFGDLQISYEKALRDSTHEVSSFLRAEVYRSTLWLANNGGKLVRWATEGNRYCGIEYLKSIPTGHDSPWIAGEAIGSEEVKLKDVKRSRHVKPAWRSVLAVPIYVGDGVFPDCAVAVLTCGLSLTAARALEYSDELANLTRRLSEQWRNRISGEAFTRDTH